MLQNTINSIFIGEKISKLTHKRRKVSYKLSTDTKQMLLEETLFLICSAAFCQSYFDISNLEKYYNHKKFDIYTCDYILSTIYTAYKCLTFFARFH